MPIITLLAALSLDATPLLAGLVKLLVSLEMLSLLLAILLSRLVLRSAAPSSLMAPKVEPDVTRVVFGGRVAEKGSRGLVRPGLMGPLVDRLGDMPRYMLLTTAAEFHSDAVCRRTSPLVVR